MASNITSSPTTKSGSSQIAYCSSCQNNFPMVEWHLISPSQRFWKLNVDLTFVDESLRSLQKKLLSSSTSTTNIESLILITFQSQEAALSPLAQKRIDNEKLLFEPASPSDTTTTKAEATKTTEEEKEYQDQVPSEGATTKKKDDQGTYMYSEKVTEWKDSSRENVLAFFDFVSEKLKNLSTTADADGNAPSYWFDVVDPATGQPVEGVAGPSLFCESDSIEQLLKMPVVSVGIGNSVCRLVQHPKFGLNVYPASMFYVGPRELLLEALQDL